MTLQSLLKEDLIFDKVKARELSALFDELVGHLTAAAKIKPTAQQEIVELLNQREIETSTAIGHGIAIPHARLPKNIENIPFTVIFARSFDGIDFNAQDEIPIKLILLLLIPEDNSNTHLKILAQAVRLLSNSENRRALLEAESRKEIYEIFQKKLS